MLAPALPVIQPADGTWRQAGRRITPGAILRHVIHFLFDCIDAFIRPRARHKLWILDLVKICSVCKVRERLIDQYTLHYVNKARRWLGQLTTRAGAKV